MNFDRFKLLENYHNQGRSAARRKIEFEISFEDWLQIWVDSGKLHLRGIRKGQYVMARNGDKGPYKVGNVRIILSSDNHKEQWVNKPAKDRVFTKAPGRAPWNKGKKWPQDIKLKMSNSHMGKKCPFNSERAKQLGFANIGRLRTPETREKMRVAKLGKKHSVDTIKKMSAARKKYWDNRRMSLHDGN